MPRFFPMDRVPYELLEMILRNIKEQSDVLNWLRAFDLNRNKYSNFKDMFVLIDLVGTVGIRGLWPILEVRAPLNMHVINQVTRVSHLLDRIKFDGINSLETLLRMKHLSRKPIVELDIWNFPGPEDLLIGLGGATRLNELVLDLRFEVSDAFVNELRQLNLTRAKFCGRSISNVKCLAGLSNMESLESLSLGRLGDEEVLSLKKCLAVSKIKTLDLGEIGFSHLVQLAESLED